MSKKSRATGKSADPRRTNRGRRKPWRTIRLQLEQLEDRIVPAISPSLSGRNVTFEGDIDPTQLYLRTDPVNVSVLQYSTDNASWSSDLDPAPGTQSLNLSAGATTISLKLPGDVHLVGITEAGKALTIDARNATSEGTTLNPSLTPLVRIEGPLLTGGGDLTVTACDGVT